MRAERFVISDHCWQMLEPLLPGSSQSRGVTAKDSRLFLEAVLWKVRVGEAWRDLAIRALRMDIALRLPPRGCIFHSDRGSQYCSHDYQKIIREHGFKA